MKRPLKIGIGVVIAAIVVIAGVALFVVSSMDSLIQTAVETYGSKATKAEVRLDKVEVSPRTGEGTLSGLFVGNPKGFETPSAFELGAVRVKLDIATVTKSPIVIDEITITGPVVTYELASGGSNIDALKRNVAAFAGSEEKKAPGTQAKSEGPKLIIEKLRITGGKVNVSASALGGKKLSAPLPDITLTDIGKAKGGATPGTVIEQILDTVSRSIGKSVASLNLDKLLGAAEKRARGAVEGAVKAGTKGAAGMVKSGTEGAKGMLGSGTKGLGGTLKGLLPGSK